MTIDFLGKHTHSAVLATGLDLHSIATVLSSPDIEAALREKGEKYVRRYRLWRSYRELISSGKSKDPLVVIIAGMPCIGKTTLAQEIAARLQLGDIVGGDALRAALRQFISKEGNEPFFVNVYEAWKCFGEKTEENIRKGFLSQASIMNKGVESILTSWALKDGESMVIEYLHFFPSHFPSEILRDHSIIPLVFRIDSEEMHLARIPQRQTSTHLRTDSKNLLMHASVYRALQEYQCQDARRCNIPIIATDDPKHALDVALDHIFERIEAIVRGNS